MKTKNKKNTKKKVIRKFSWKLLISFLVFELVFTAITAPFVLLYGPFENAKSRFVGTAMASMNYQWLATTFLSDEKIAQITGQSQNSDNMGEQDESLIHIPKVQDNTIKCITLDNNDNFQGYALIVSDPTRIHVGYTSKLNSSNPEGETTSQIAINNDAIASVNGGAFTDEADTAQWTANGGTPSGIIISNGKVIYDDTNNDSKGTVAMTKQGQLVVGTFSISELLNKNVTEAVSFDTDILVYNGKATSIVGDGGKGTSPRTLIGQKTDGSIVLVVLDAKNQGSRIAATIKEAQEVMVKLECVTAATLDGGKSATMYYNDELINTPSYAFGERSIPTAIIVK
ncbi:MAG: exopolysaccharide biosynthesis protein [Clostridium sp.]|nr:exopolysaccharide biosynthesis protein [Clostridium sp.]